MGEECPPIYCREPLRLTFVQEHSPTNFELFRLTKAKREVGVSPNTIRAYALQGLRVYKMGRAAFVSRNELAEFIRKTGGAR